MAIYYISISGPDGVGKTTAIRALHKVTNYRYVVYDRDIPDQLCYAQLANRKLRIFYSKFLFKNKKQLYVVLNASENCIKSRMTKRNDFIVPKGTTLNQAIEYFEQYKNIEHKNIFYIDTTNKSVNEIVNLILKKLEEIC